MKNLLILLILITFTQITYASPDDFIITIKTDNYGVSGLNQFTLPINPDEIYDYAVDCDNDGIVEASGLTGAYTCDYAQAGIYTIRIIHDALTGDGFPAVSFQPPQIGDITDSYKLLTLDQWGTSHWTNMSYAFHDARNFVITATDSPDFSMTTSMKSMFQNAVKATPVTQNWDVSSVTDMSRMFFNATIANPSVGTWVVSSVTDMDFMFARGDSSPEMSAQPDVVNWDVSSVINMNGTFAHIKNIGDLSLWDVANVTGMMNLFSHASFENHYSLNWNTSSVTTMFGMFYNSINTPDLVNWDVSSVEDMSYMFYKCKDFEIVGQWDVALVSDMKYMFELATDIVIDTSQWNLDSLRYMEKMFANSFEISLDLTNWQLPSIQRMNDAFLNVHIPLEQYDSFLLNLYQFSLNHSVHFNAGFSQYCSASASNARTGLVDRGWSITDLGQYCSSLNPDDFVITIKGNSFTIFTDPNLTGYNYDVDCDNDGILEATSVQGDYTCNYGRFGGHTIALKHDNVTGLGAPAFPFNRNGNESANIKKIKLLNNWGTSHWQSLKFMFDSAEDMYISSVDQPNVSGVTSLNSLFLGANHAQMDVSSWDTALVTNMAGTFFSQGFGELDVSGWNTSLVTDMNSLFATPNLNSLDVSLWNISSLDMMVNTFKGLQIDTLDLSQWDTSSVTVLWGAFANTSINNLQISSLNTSAVSHFEYTFAEIEANQLDLSSWDITASPNPFMDYMFYKSTIDTLNISNWHVKNIFASGIFAESNIINLIVDNWTFEPNSNINYLFANANIQNLDLSQWNTSNIISMRNTFKNFSHSNLDLSQWNTASLINMTSLFEGADIANLNVINWNTSQVTTMANLFKDYKGMVPALSNWDFSTVTDMTDMLLNTKMLTANYDEMLVKIVQDIPQSNVVFNAGNSHFCTQAAIDARATLISTYNWTIQDAGRDCRTSSDFIITVKTDNMGSSTDTQFTLPINPSLSGYNYSIDCENDGIYEIESANATYTCNYTIAGTYTVRISHDEVSQLGFPAVFFNNSGDKLKLISIEQWGEGIWADMTGAFYGTSNLVVNAEDMPNLSQVNDMADMFNGVTLATQTYENLLVYLKENLAVTNLNFHAGNSLYCSLEAYQSKTVLQSELNWMISDGGYGCYQPADNSDLVFSVFLHEDQLVISENAGINNPSFDYNIDCNNDGIIEAYNVHGTYTCLYPNGSYTSKTVRVEHNLPNDEGFPELAIINNINGYNPMYILHQWGTVKWDTLYEVFANTNGLHILDLSSPNLSQAYSLRALFAYAKNISVDLSQWNVSSITDMGRMFSSSQDLQLDLSGWDASSVTSLSGMFYGSQDLQLNLTGWDVSSVTDLSYMFGGSHDLSLDTLGWSTFFITNMNGIFSGAYNISIDTSSWNTSSVTDMSYMFNGAHDLILDTNGWNTSAVTNMSAIFANAYNLSIDTSSWNTSSITNMSYMFIGSHDLSLNTSIWNTLSVTDMSNMFSSAHNLSLDTSDWNTSAVTNMSGMFSGAHELSIDTSNWNTSSVTNMLGMFSNAHDLLIDTSNWNTSAITNMYYMFRSAQDLSLNLNGWNTSSVTDMTGMFLNSHDLSFDISGWDTSAVTNMRYIYADSSNVPIALDVWDVSSLLYLDGAFINTSLPIQKYDDILINFAGQNVNSFVQFDVGDTQYCNLLAADARFILVETYNWTINDGGYCGYMFKDGFE